MTDLARRNYGYINGTYAGQNYPLTVGALQSSNVVQGSYHLTNFFGAYTRCLADAEMAPMGATEPSIVRRRIGFLSLDNVVEWINTNVPNDGAGSFEQGCKIQFYDEIDPRIEPIRKVYGKNTRRASLCPNGKYYSSPGDMTAQDSWSGSATFLDAVWSDLFGGSLNPGGPGAWTRDDYQCFWFAGGRNTFYACPSPALVDIALNAVGSNMRYMRRLADGVRTDAATGHWNMSSGSFDARVVMNSKNGGSIDFHSIGRGSNLMQEWEADWTMMVAYPLEDGIGNQAVLLKPLGVDSLYFNYFDESRYRLEMLSSRGPQTSWHRLFTVNTATAFTAPEGNSLGPIEMGQLISTTINANQFSHRRYKPADMYFHLRDLVTNRVSPISPQFIQWTNHRGAATIAPLVRVRPHL